MGTNTSLEGREISKTSKVEVSEAATRSQQLDSGELQQPVPALTSRAKISSIPRTIPMTNFAGVYSTFLGSDMGTIIEL